MPVRIYRFDKFELNTGDGELRVNGGLIRLQEKPLLLLATLLEHPQQMVARDELRKRMWSSDTFVDFEQGINVAINKVRDALGDSADEPKYIQTIAKKGYKFLLPVEVRETTPASLQAAEPADATVHSIHPEVEVVQSAGVRRWWTIGALTVSALVIVASFAFSHHRNTPSVPQISAIAVLPMQNLSSDPDQEFFADGMTDELITDLAKVHGLRVISRTSVMRYKSTVAPVPQIARELNVQAIVEGTVLRSAGRVRIRVQLIDARSDTHLWAEAYERKQQDAMSLQNEVAGAIARQINFELAPQRNGSSSTIPEPNFEAQSAYLKGRYFWNERNDYGMRKASEYFQQAIALDPKYARAYVGLADCYILGAPPTDPPNVLAPKIRDLLKKALEIDDSLGEAHATLGLLAQNHDWDWAEAEKQYKLAIYLSPNYATAHQWYAEYLTLRGRYDLAFEQMKLARDLDPLSLVIIKDSGELDYNAGNYDEAIEYLHKALEMDPNFITAHRLLAMTYVQKREFSPAIEELLKSSQIEAAPDTLAELGYVYAVAGRKQDAEKILKDLKVISERRYTCARDYALIYMGLGEKDKAFEWLDKAYREKAQLVELKVDPRWNSLRTDSRFGDLMRRMGLTS